MEYKIVDGENIANDHICCALGPKKGEDGINLKKAWLKDRFDDGLVFYKLDVRAKVFIEYIPSDKVWMPIQGGNGFHINCLWVSGRYKGEGHANHLLDYCIGDGRRKGKDYISIVSSDKKRPYLSDPKFLKHKGFELVDKIGPYYELYCLRLKGGIKTPKFIDNQARLLDKKDFLLYYSHQCPFGPDYAKKIKDLAESRGYQFHLELLDTREKAVSSPGVFTSYSLYRDGRFITNEILSEKKFLGLLE